MKIAHNLLGCLAGLVLLGAASGASAQVLSGGASAPCSAFGTVLGTCAQGNDSRITGALQAANNFSDVVSAATAKANLGLVAVASSGSAADLTVGTLSAARGGAGTITGALRGDGAGNVTQAVCADLSNAGAGCAGPAFGNLTGPITSTGLATAIASQTGTGSTFVMQASPTLTTPVLGVATATSLAIGGATIGANGLAVNGNILGNNNIVSGGNVQANNNNGHTWSNGSGLTSSGSALFQWANNGSSVVFPFSIPVTATMQYGGANAASPVAQTLSTQGSRSGTDSNVSGANLTIAAGQGTGNATGSSLLLQAPLAVASGTSAQTMTTFLTGTAVLVSSTLPWTLSNAAIILSGIASDGGATDATVCQKTSDGTILKGSGTLGICLGTSSIRYKHDIVGLSAGLAEIMALQPVSYHLNADHGDPNKVLYGFTAEQAGSVLPELLGLDSQGRPNTFDYLGVVPVLVKAIHEMQHEIDDLKHSAPGSLAVAQMETLH